MTPNVRRSLVWSLFGLLVAAALAWSFWPQGVSVEMARVTRGPLEVDVSDEGRTRVREIYQVSAPVAGRLLRIEEHAGDTVVADKTVVAALLPTRPTFLDIRTRAQAESAVKSAEAARNLAAAELNRARAELAFAQSDLKRAESLIAAKAISQTVFERARLARSTAIAQLGTAQAALQAKTFDLETAKAFLIDPSDLTAAARERSSIPLLAPVSGKVLRVLHENEAVVAAGAPIVEIGDPRALEIVVELISEEAVKVREGARATITDWGGAGPLNARVRRVEPSGFTKVSALGVEEQRVNVLLDFTDPIGKWEFIADGFRVIAHIAVWEGKNVLRVPAAATFRSGAAWAVFVVRDGRARLTTIALGKSNDDFAEVTRGLSEGDTVITHPSDRVTDGARVSERK